MSEADNKRRIAVCLRGPLRMWDYSYMVYEMMEELFPKYHFDYYFAIWDNLAVPIFNEDFTKLTSKNADIGIESLGDFVKGRNIYFESLDEAKFREKHQQRSDVFELGIHYGRTQLNIMKTRVELEEDFVYDMILENRTDIVFNTNSIYTLCEFATSKPEHNRTMSIGSEIIVSSYAQFDYWANDCFFFGSSFAYDIFSNLGDEIYRGGDIHNSHLNFHTSDGYFIQHNGLVHLPLDKIHNGGFDWVIIRPNVMKFGESYRDGWWLRSDLSSLRVIEEEWSSQFFYCVDNNIYYELSEDGND